jgi:hypothetical protein
MDSMPPSSVVDHGFVLWLGHTKDYKIGICCFSIKYPALRTKTGWHGNRIMCRCRATCLSVDCCFS